MKLPEQQGKQGCRETRSHKINYETVNHIDYVLHFQGSLDLKTEKNFCSSYNIPVILKPPSLLINSQLTNYVFF